MASKPIIEMPKMSWERPIELEMLEWLAYMAHNMGSGKQSGWFADKERNAEIDGYVQAYEAAHQHLTRELEFRKKIGVYNA